MVISFVITVFYTVVVGMGLFFVGEALPRKWFHAEKFPFRPWGWERGGRVYDKVRVKKWKDRVPDMSRVRKKMIPKRLGVAPRAEQVYRLVQETCVAEVIHVALIFCGVPIPFFWREHRICGVILTVGYALGNLVFVVIQRYNRPMLLSLAKRLEEREVRQQNAHRNCAQDSDPLG